MQTTTRRHRGRRFVMTSESPSVDHRFASAPERHHVAMEVRQTRSNQGDGWGPTAAEEIVRGLLPWAAASALGVPPHYRKHERGPKVDKRSTPAHADALTSTPEEAAA